MDTVIDSALLLPFALKVCTRTTAAGVELAVDTDDTTASAVARAEVDAINAVDDPGTIVFDVDAAPVKLIVKSAVTAVPADPDVYGVTTIAYT